MIANKFSKCVGIIVSRIRALKRLRMLRKFIKVNKIRTRAEMTVIVE